MTPPDASKAEHTKGPWHWDADEYAVVEGVTRWRYRVCARGRTIMQTYYTEAERGQAEADTKLAAAAPELLAALLLCQDAMEHMGNVMNNMDVVEEEDEIKTKPAFDAMRAVLEKVRP